MPLHSGVPVFCGSGRPNPAPEGEVDLNHEQEKSRHVMQGKQHTVHRQGGNKNSRAHAKVCKRRNRKKCNQ